MSTSTHDRSANIWPNIFSLRMHEAIYVSQISLKFHPDTAFIYYFWNKVMHLEVETGGARSKSINN